MLTTGLALLRSAGRYGQPLRRLATPTQWVSPFSPRLMILPSQQWHSTIRKDETRRKQSTASPTTHSGETNRDALQSKPPTPRGRYRIHQVPWWSLRLKYFGRSISPNRSLVIRLQNRADPEELKLVTTRFAGSRSIRLPVLLMQRMIRLEEEELKTDISTYLQNPVEWRIKLNIMAFRGIEMADVDQWHWILSAEDDVTRLKRFLDSDRFRPMFVLLHILRFDADFRQGDLFPALLEYIRQYHAGPDWIRNDPVRVRNLVRRSLATRFNTTTSHFMILLARLVHHCLHVWPAALPAIAQIVCSFLDGIRNSRQQHQARQRSLLFNYAMRLFKKPASLNPVLNTKFNWKAQRVLLAYSTSLDRPLVIDQQSYRAMRRVMLGLSKSLSEKMVTARQALTWPPFRQNWDGLDERREAQDDFSRSVKAGVVARENGYVDTLSDEALGVLGGTEPDGFPMIQTRSLPEQDWVGFNANQNIYLAWAARVKATRNLHEAWAQFKAHPAPGMRPNFRVYAEIFNKAFAPHVSENTVLLPGDAPNQFPFPDANLSDFEKARISPPSVRELYSQMLEEGLRPVGSCLATLIRNAVSLGKAMDYLCDSPLDLEAIEIMRPPREGAKRHPIELRGWRESELREKMDRIPLPIFSAFIHTLCRFQPRVSEEPARAGNRGRIGFLSHAMQLVNLRLPLHLAVGRRNKAPWHTTLRTIAAPRVVVEAPGFDDPDFNDLLALRLFMRHYNHVESAIGTDIVLFDALCRVTQKGAAALANRHPGGYPSFWQEVSGLKTKGAVGFQDDLRRAHDLMKHSFQLLTQPVDRGGHILKLPHLLHGVTPAHLHLFLRALGYLHDTDEMVAAMRWAIGTWEADKDTAFEDAKDPDHKHHFLMTQALAFFRAYTEDVVPPGVLRELKDKTDQLMDEQGGTWAWPTAEEAERYRRFDERERTQWFWRAIEGEQTETRDQLWRAVEQADEPRDVEQWSSF